MLITKCLVQNRVLFSILLVTALYPVTMKAASESDRLERLERAVEQLQKRNAELEAEVRSLKQQTAAVPDPKFKTKIIHDGIMPGFSTAMVATLASTTITNSCM
jgi:uncharacterized protein YlxW (UPF0749 family)